MLWNLGRIRSCNQVKLITIGPSSSASGTNAAAATRHCTGPASRSSAARRGESAGSRPPRA